MTPANIRDVIFAELKRQANPPSGSGPLVAKDGDFTDVLLDGRFDVEAVARVIHQALQCQNRNFPL